MGQVGGIERIVQASAQQLVQPVVVAGVEVLDAGGVGSRHREYMSMGDPFTRVNKN
jgi:hypothetical protein